MCYERAVFSSVCTFSFLLHRANMVGEAESVRPYYLHNPSHHVNPVISFYKEGRQVLAEQCLAHHLWEMYYRLKNTAISITKEA